jgi:hypothetical protein
MFIAELPWVNTSLIVFLKLFELECTDGVLAPVMGRADAYPFSQQHLVTLQLQALATANSDYGPACQLCH